MKQKIIFISLLLGTIAFGLYYKPAPDIPDNLIENIVNPKSGRYFKAQIDGIPLRQYIGGISVEHHAPIDSSKTNINTLDRVYIFFDDETYDITDFVKQKYMEINK